jgi:hypothetical protein
MTNMESFQQELLDVLAQQEEALTDYVLKVNRDNMPLPGGVHYSAEDLRQMVKGFWHLVREGIAGTGRELREVYKMTVFPGLRDSGTPARQMVTGSARVLFHVAWELVSRISEKERAPAQEWLIAFFSDHLGDMAEVWATSR